jgi:hypothetical protein
VREGSLRAELVDCRFADAEAAGDLGDGKKATTLNPCMPALRSRRLFREQNPSDLLPMSASRWTDQWWNLQDISRLASRYQRMRSPPSIWEQNIGGSNPLAPTDLKSQRRFSLNRLILRRWR